jgi:hypothetical protein
MTLSDKTIGIYRALDSSVLLALLPALRDEADRTKAESEAFERARQAIPEPSTGVVERLGEAAAARPRRANDQAGAADYPPRARDRLAGSDGELAKVLDQLASYRADLLERERWIRAELVRRGLLPEYPFWGDR